MFEQFQNHYAEKYLPVKADTAVLKKLKGRLPEAVLDFFAEQGFSGYSNGLFFTLNPLDWQEDLTIWLEDDGVEKLPIARTAFGSIFYYRNFSDKPDFSMLNVLSQKSTVITGSVEIFFDKFLTDRNIIEKVMKKPLFDKVLKKLGPLNHDTVYGFFPALALGGAETVKNTKIVQYREHLSILQQF